MRVSKYFYIYKTTYVGDGRVYIGQRGCNCLPEHDKGYIGSGSHFLNAVKKYGKDKFLKEIIELCIIENVDDREIYFISFYDARNPLVGFNRQSGGHTKRGVKQHEETKKIISEKVKERNKDPEYIKFISERNKEAQNRPEVKEQKKRENWTEETVRKHSEGIKNSKQNYDTSAAAKRGWTEERIIKRKEELKTNVKFQEFVQKGIVHNIKLFNSPEGELRRKEITENNLKMWSDPEFKESQSEKIKQGKKDGKVPVMTEEGRRLKSEASKIKVKCPHCDFESNKGNVTQHISRKHLEETSNK